MKTVLYMHGGSGNHGCEALVRTTTKLVKQYLDSEVVLWSTGKDEDIKYGIADVVDKILATEEMNHKSLPFIMAYIQEICLKKQGKMYDLFVKSLFKNSVAISIGGDNYCYPWSAKWGVDIDKKVRQVCKKNVFWGCSISRDDITDAVKDDLKGFDLITARESISYNILKEINQNTVMVSDPAFLLDKRNLPLPEGFIENNTVGINISPMIFNYENKDNITFENYVMLIEYILKNTNMNVCLIPHVIWEKNCDLDQINKLYELFKDTGRVVKIKDYNCEELKGFISRCRFFIGARTHATIAAYSTCVPTLVVGYSVKSKGIATDLFGTYENYVIPVQLLTDKNQLTEKFSFIVNNESKIKKHLQNIMPKYKEQAKISGEHLAKLLIGD